MIANRVSRLTTTLSLTASQAAQATSIFTSAQTSLSTLQTTLDGYRTSLQTAVKSNSTATIDSVSSAIGTTFGQITAIQNRADAAFYAILTADQQAKLTAGSGFGFGGPGGRGPRP
jgi:Spy/CpxP family protein refolding chaperone